MVFSSIPFVFFFFPIVLAAYFISKEKYRNYILLIASLLFYAYGEPKFVVIMIASIIINYAAAILIDKKRESRAVAKAVLVVSLIVNIGILYIFKYLDFSINIFNSIFKTELPLQNIALPIGISFFTFQAISYVIDVYRGTVPVQKNPLFVALYISFFPQLVAGPIVRYSTIEQQIASRVCTVEKFWEGMQRFILGFCKKIILANNLYMVVEEAFKNPQSYSSANPAFLWLGSICFTLQIYYDFSGYSDMAIGLGKMFGFDFEENFNYPYISRSVTEFWRRWHMSLGQWFRDYVYFPMGGSRVSVPRHIFNLFVVWALTGFWHGANFTFIVWGLLYFVLLVVEKFLIKPMERKNKVFLVFWFIVTIFSVNLGWVLFNSNNITDAMNYIVGMFGGFGTPFAIDDHLIRYVREYGVFIVAGILFSTPVVKKLRSVIEKKEWASNTAVIVSPICYAFGFLWSVSYLVLGAHNPFIYFNF